MVKKTHNLSSSPLKKNTSFIKRSILLPFKLIKKIIVYFLEGLKNIDSEEIFIEFTTNVNPCIIRPADEVKYTYLLLPVRISSNI